MLMLPKCTVSCAPSSTQLFCATQATDCPSADTAWTVRYALVVSDPENRYWPTKMLRPGCRPASPSDG